MRCASQLEMGENFELKLYFWQKKKKRFSDTKTFGEFASILLNCFHWRKKVKKWFPKTEIF